MVRINVGEKAFEKAKHQVIEQIKSNIDSDYLRKLCLEKYGIRNLGSLEYKEGDIVMDGDEVAFKLDFEIRLPVSFLISGKENSTNSLTQSDAEPIEVVDELDEMLEALNDDEDRSGLSSIVAQGDPK